MVRRFDAAGSPDDQLDDLVDGLDGLTAAVGPVVAVELMRGLAHLQRHRARAWWPGPDGPPRP
jgi:hypothetical protein